jgi:hypothetical protein
VQVLPTLQKLVLALLLTQLRPLLATLLKQPLVQPKTQ